MDAIAILGRLRRTFRKAEYHQRTERALKRLVEGTGMSDRDIEEICVLGYDLSPQGERRIPVGRFEAVFRLVDWRTLELKWRREGGAEQKSVPATVKDNHERELRVVRAVARDIREELRVQRRRLEDLLATDRHWDFGHWRRYYLDHPVVGVLARKLIWRIGDGDDAVTVMWAEGEPVDGSDAVAGPFADDSVVRLWHPVDAGPGEAAAWRHRLLGRGTRQPFKQAFRESYVPTEAERETGSYSNRFAGHYVREGRLASLFRAREWMAARLGDFDPGGIPLKFFKEANTLANFRVEPVRDASLQSPSGLYLYAGTDRVDFTQPGRPDCVPLEEVPPRIFSETMRDVDLFISVCSIGADPTWEDRGADHEMDGYWADYANGHLLLGEFVAIRHEVLKAVLPWLKIAKRCTLDDRHLLVRGNRLTYRINLRSGAVFTEPGQRHLCILSDAAGTRAYDKLLPFHAEEDPIVAIILAKAFLLAADDQITDRLINRQIEQAARD